MKQYSVSIVYLRQGNGKIDTKLRCLIIKAVSEEEAFGKGVYQFDKETLGYEMNAYCVLELIDENNQEN